MRDDVRQAGHQSAAEVEHQKLPFAQTLFQARPEDPQKQHVKAQVQQAAMQETAKRKAAATTVAFRPAR
jgi:hypothetical protein